MERKLETLMKGLTFGEGPRWHENKFYFSDFYSHKVYSLDLSGKHEVIVCLLYTSPSPRDDT